MSITVDLTVEQLVDLLSKLTPGEAETLIETLERRNLIARWEQIKREVAEGRLVTEEELFADLD
jgi:hypothetical protein